MTDQEMERRPSFLASFFSFFVAAAAFAQMTFPDPIGYVNDFANILSETTEQEITQIIEETIEETSAEIAVVTVESLEGYDANYYSVELGRAWGIGNKERDDGVLFLTAVSDRETYIATGYGVEEFITDAQAFWITDSVVVPFFREGDYDGGILSGVERISSALTKLEPLPDLSQTEYEYESNDSSISSIVFIIFFIISFVFPWFAAVFARSKRWWPGGIVGGIVGLVVSLIFAVTLLIIIPLALFGFLFDYLASTNFKKGKDSWWTGGGKSGWGSSSSWGGSSSSTWSSGSSSSSSFGGFSGGSFGGGGGGSSW